MQLPLADTASVEAIHILPSLLWIVFAICIVFVFRTQIGGALQRLSSVKIRDFEATFGETVASASESRGQILGYSEGSRLVRRAERAEPLLAGARILWVDDQPQSTESERAALTDLGVTVTAVTSTDAGLATLESGKVDLLISDMDREGNPQAGRELVDELKRTGIAVPVIFYVSRLDPARGTPPGALGITNRPSELVDLVIDGLERTRT